MLWLVLGFLLTPLGLAMLSYYSDWPGAGNDAYLRNVGAAGGFLAFLGLVSFLYSASLGVSGVYHSLVASLLIGAAGSGYLRYRRRTKSCDLALPLDERHPERVS